MGNLENHLGEIPDSKKEKPLYSAQSRSLRHTIRMRMEELVMAGLPVKQVAHRFRAHPSTVYRIYHSKGISLVDISHSKAREAIKSVISSGAETYEDLQKATNLSSYAIMSYCQGAGINLKRRKSARMENREGLIREGLPINQIAKEEGVKPSAIYYHIKSHGLGEIRKISKRRYNKALQNPNFERKIIIGNIVSSALRNAYQNEKDWAAREAVRYSCNRGNSRYLLPLEKVLSVLRDYDEARNSGERISFKKIAEKAGIGTMSARRIILHAGGESLYWTNPFMPHGKKSGF